MIYTVECYSFFKRTKILETCYSQDVLSKVNQTQKDKCCMIPVIETKSNKDYWAGGGWGEDGKLFNEYRVSVMMKSSRNE